MNTAHKKIIFRSIGLSAIAILALLAVNIASNYLAERRNSAWLEDIESFAERFRMYHPSLSDRLTGVGTIDHYFEHHWDTHG